MSKRPWPYWLRFNVFFAVYLIGALSAWLVGPWSGDLNLELRIIVIGLAWTIWIPALFAWHRRAKTRDGAIVYLGLLFYIGWEVQFRILANVLGTISIC